jgi:BCD family chlorophyll transporter-like MFS transporter
VLNYAGVGYSAVYHLELVLLFATLAAIGPLVRDLRAQGGDRRNFGLAEFPG